MSDLLKIRGRPKVSRLIIQLLVSVRFVLDYKSLKFGFLDFIALIAGLIMFIEARSGVSVKKNFTSRQLLAFFICPFIACSCILAFLNSSDYEAVIKFQIKLLVLFSVIRYCKNLKKEDSDSWIKLFANLIYFSATISIFEFLLNVDFLGKSKGSDSINRGSGLFLWPNIACIAFGIGLIYTIFHANGFKRDKFLKIGILAFGILSTSSLAGTFGTVIALIYIAWKKGFKYVFAAIAVFPIIYFSILSSSRFGSRLSQIRLPSSEMVLAGKSEDSFTWRLIQWKKVYTEVEKFPIFGHGLGSSSDLSIVDGYLPHNDYLRMLVDIGFLGLSLILFGVLFYWAKLTRIGIEIERQYEIKAYILLLLISSSAENVINQTTIYFLVPFLIFLKRT